MRKESHKDAAPDVRNGSFMKVAHVSLSFNARGSPGSALVFLMRKAKRISDVYTAL